MQGKESGRGNGRSKGSEVGQARRLLEKPRMAAMKPTRGGVRGDKDWEVGIGFCWLLI